MKRYTLLNAQGELYRSPKRGLLGGYSRRKIYGRLDCPHALREIARGHYVPYRVFFADEATAVAAGYRPCGVCMCEKYRRWQEAQPAKKKATRKKKRKRG